MDRTICNARRMLSATGETSKFSSTSGEASGSHSDFVVETGGMVRMGLEKLEEAIDLIPVKEKEAYLEARVLAWEVFCTESDPVRFLRFEGFNAWAAAKRIVSYWFHRKEIFGERAFLPMDLTGQGALRKEEMSIFNNPVFAILPKDGKGRSVAFFDRSKSAVSNLRATFVCFQILSENEMSQREGPRIIYLLNNISGAAYNRQVVRPMVEVLRTGMPLKAPVGHIVCCPPQGRERTYTERIIPLMLHHIGRFLSTDKVVHIANSSEDACASLERAGFQKEGLPKCLSGTLDEDGFLQWQRDRGRVVERLEDLSTLVNSTLSRYSSTRIQRKLDYLSNIVQSTLENYSAVEQVYNVSATNNRNATLGNGKRPVLPCGRFPLDAVPPVGDRREARLAKTRKKKGNKKPAAGAAASTGGEDEDEEARKAKKRKLDAEYARRKRARLKIEIEVQKEHCSKLSDKNARLKQENSRLERIMKTVMEKVARIETSASSVSVPSASIRSGGDSLVPGSSVRRSEEASGTSRTC